MASLNPWLYCTTGPTLMPIGPFLWLDWTVDVEQYCMTDFIPDTNSVGSFRRSCLLDISAFSASAVRCVHITRTVITLGADVSVVLWHCTVNICFLVFTNVAARRCNNGTICPVLSCPGFFLGLTPRSKPWTDLNRLWLRWRVIAQGCSFWGFGLRPIILRGSNRAPQKGGVVRHFPAKLAKLYNCNSSGVEDRINTKF